MATSDLSTVRSALDAERAGLARQLEDVEADANTDDVDENFADSAQVAAEHVENRTLAAQLTDQLADVEAALARIDDGTYGRCEICDEPVAAARLEAMPSTRFCIDHA